MKLFARLLQQLKLRHLLFLLLLVAGIVPLAVSGYLVVQQNREILETQERTYLTRSAQFLSLELNEHLLSTQTRLAQFGQTLLLAPPDGEIDEKLRQPWLQQRFQSLLSSNSRSELAAVRVLNLEGRGPYAAAVRQTPELSEALDASFTATLETDETTYRFLVLPDTGEPVAILAVPIRAEGGDVAFYVQGVVPLHRMESVFEQETQGDVQVFLVDREGELLWWGDADSDERQAVTLSRLVKDFVATPLNMTQEYLLELQGQQRRMLGRISPVEAPGWGILVHRPADLVPEAVKQMVVSTAVSSGTLLALALVIAFLATRKLSRPIQQLADHGSEPRIPRSGG
jgi:hypothetical protein